MPSSGASAAPSPGASPMYYIGTETEDSPNVYRPETIGL
jgi:hypothetical protein